MPLRRSLVLLAVLLLGRVSAAAVHPPLVITLESGLTVVTQQDEASAISVLEILIKGGQRAEPPGREGLAYVATRLAMDIPDQRKVQNFMAKALHYSMTVRDDASVIRLECLTEFFDEILGEFLQILTDPLINNIRLDRTKEFIDHRRRIEADDAVNLGRLAHREAFFKGTGYDGSIFGTAESLKEVKVREARDFYDRFFVPGNMVLVSVSNLADEEMQALLARRFASLQAAPRSPDAPTSLRAFQVNSPGPSPRVIEKQTQQNFIGAAFILPATTPRLFVLSFLLENILGRGPGSRLWSLRSERKLAYNVGAVATPMREAGLFEAFLEASPDKADEAREALAEALREFHDRGITADELETGKTELKAFFLRSNERKTSRVSTLSLMAASGVGAGLFASFADELAAVTLEEANAFIREHLDPAAASWVVVGPKK